MTEDASTFKDQGNAEYKAERWLKAAALYSKGLKLDPSNAILLSNRSAAFLKLNKIQKALADAEECIRQKPDWDKGYFRKGSILESIKEYETALSAYQQAAKLNPDSREVSLKVKAIGRIVRNANSHQANGHSKTNGATQTITVDAKSEIPRSEQRLEEFKEQIVQIVEKEIHSRTFEKTFPCVFFLPGKLDENGEEKMGQVSIQAAFDSPSTLANATEFLRQYGSENSSQAALAIVPKHKIAYPQVWQKQDWPIGKSDGFILQLEAPKIRKLWYISLGQKKREPTPLDAKFAVLEALFR